MACNYLVLGLVIHTNRRGVWINFYFSLPVDPVDFIVLGKICAARRFKVNIEINGDVMSFMERDLWLSLSLYRQVI